MKRILLLSMVFSFVLATTAWAQRTVSGKVTDENGEGLPGVNVVIKGTTTGVTTDLDGNFQITVPGDDAILVFTSVGMATQEVVVGSRTSVDLAMSIDTKQLQEVVVVGYGDQSRDKLTSAVSVVSNAEISSFNATTSIDQILQGKAAGVSVTGANGRPGQTALINIRGITSIQGGTDPLYIVDGVPVDASNVNNINPADIESISILKDAATAALYGSRAGNGVVVITTKTGRKGEAQVTLRISQGYSDRIPDNYDMMNAEQKLRYERELADLGVSGALSRPGGANQPEDWGPFLNRATDWEGELLRSGSIRNYSVAVTGGNDYSTYFFSVSKDENTGIIQSLNGFDRISTRLNTTQQVKEYLKVGTNLTIARSQSDIPRDRNNVQNPFRAIYDYNPYESVYRKDDDGEFILDANGEKIYNTSGLGGFNIYEALRTNVQSTSNLVTVGSAFAEFKFLENFTNRTTVGMSNDRYVEEYFIKPGSILDQIVGDANNPGSKRDNGSNDYRFVVTNVLGYSKTFGNHQVSGRLLYEYNKRRFTSYSLSSTGFVTDRLSIQNISSQPTDVGSFATENILASYGGFFNYSYDNRYVLDLSVRRDGSSRFGVDNRWGTFYAVSSAWNIHNEAFWNLDFVNSLRLRASYGTSGNQEIGDFASLSTVLFQSRNGQSTVIPAGEADPGLQWESQRIFDIGIETSIWDNRITLVADYFKRTSSDLLGEQPLSNSVGDEDNTILTNIGEIQTSGVEFELSAELYSSQDWLVTFGGNIFFLDTKVNELSGGSDIFRNFTILREGEEINSFFLNRYAGVNPANGEPLWYTADGEVTNVFNGDDAVLLKGKSPQAKFQGGFFLNARWKGLDMRADMVFRGGNYIYNTMEQSMLQDGTTLNSNERTDAFNYWKEPGDQGVLPSPLFGQQSARTSDRFLQRGDYMRLRNITVGYTLPTQIAEKAGLDFVRVFVQGQNLWTYRPFFKGDPEVGIGSGETIAPGANGFVTGEFNLFSYPNQKIYTGGIEIRF